MGRQAVQVSEVGMVEMETWSPVVEGTLLADRVASHVKTKKADSAIRPLNSYM